MAALLGLMFFFQRKKQQQQQHDEPKLRQDSSLALLVLDETSGPSDQRGDGGSESSTYVPPAAATQRRTRSTDFSLAQIEQATDGFAEHLKLAEGAFGAVYRGLMRGTAVAIKVLTRKDDPNAAHSEYSGANSFALEAKVLGKYRHANIVGLVGQCLGPEQPQQYLVYEFMAGGSLKDRLQEGKTADPALSWQERFIIASDTARGLEYLHVEADPPIIHQDIKSDNILLNEYNGQLVAKIADFGAVRIAPALLTSTHYSAPDVIGTKPYQPPEYTGQGHVSEKTDTYAFGVVVLELLTGKPPTNPSTHEFLALEMDPVLQSPDKLLLPVLDPRLLGGGAKKAKAASSLPRALKKRLLALGRIAGKCVDMHVRRRCALREVLVELDVLAGREAVVRAGRGEEYDPMTGKLVSTVRAAPASKSKSKKK